MENTLSEELLSRIEEISNIEVNEAALLISIIKKNITDLIEKNLKIVEDDFVSKCSFYNKKIEEVSKEKEEILNGYKEQFYNIASKLEEEYMNFALELQDAQSNQKIALVNLKKVSDSKIAYLSSGEYEIYKTKIKNLEDKMNNCLIKEEFDKIADYLDNVVDPIDGYNKKLDAYAQKYVEYYGLEEACITNLRNCNSKIDDAINSVMQYDFGELEVAKKSSILTIFSKILNRIVGSKKFEKEYVSKKREDLEKIRVNSITIIENLDKEIDKALIVLNVYNSRINQAFKQAI